MRTSRWFLRTALALPIVLLIGLAVRTWRLEGAQLELEYRSSVRSLALGVAARLERWRDGEAWPDERIAGAGAEPLPANGRNTPERDRLLLLSAQFDRVLARDGAQAAGQWLDERIASDDGGELVAWARLRRAGIARQLGDTAAARATWAGLGRTDIGRDERGLRFDLIARALDLFDQPTAAAAAALAVDLAADQLDAEDVANVALCERVLATHADCVDDQRAHRELLERVDELRLDATWSSMRRTLDREPTTAPRVELQTAGGGWLVTFAPSPEGEMARVRGLPLARVQADLFASATGDLIDELGIRIELLAPDGSRWACSTPDAEPLSAAIWLAREDLPAGLGVVAVAVEPSSAAAERRSARRQGWLIAIGLAVIAAFFAGILGLRALHKQEQLNDDRQGFVAAVSHELKTPLTATRLLGELLERGNLEEAKVREFGGRIARESERLDHLVRNVLDLARVERIGLEPGRAQLEVPALLLDEAIARHEGLSTEAATPPLQRIEPGAAALRVLVDRESLLGALGNLIENAIRHASGSDRIELAVVAAGRRIRLEVRDRGPGVPEHEREAIFGEFKRGGSEDTRKTQGTGIGLALVARIAKAHGGRAFCEPRAGGGSVFSIELPLAKAEKNP